TALRHPSNALLCRANAGAPQRGTSARRIRRRVLPSRRRARGFATFGAVEEHPGREVFREVFEAVLGACGDEEHLAGLEGAPYATVHEGTGARNDHVDLIARMGLLPVGFTRTVHLDA